MVFGGGASWSVVALLLALAALLPGQATAVVRRHSSYRLREGGHTYVFVPGAAVRATADFIVQGAHLGPAVDAYAARHALPFRHEWKLRQTTLQHLDWQGITTERRFFVVMATGGAAELAAQAAAAARHARTHHIVAVALGFALRAADERVIAAALQGDPRGGTLCLTFVSGGGTTAAAVAEALNVALSAVPSGSIVAVLPPGTRLAARRGGAHSAGEGEAHGTGAGSAPLGALDVFARHAREQARYGGEGGEEEEEGGGGHAVLFLPLLTVVGGGVPRAGSGAEALCGQPLSIRQPTTLPLLAFDTRLLLLGGMGGNSSSSSSSGGGSSSSGGGGGGGGCRSERRWIRSPGVRRRLPAAASRQRWRRSFSASWRTRARWALLFSAAHPAARLCGGWAAGPCGRPHARWGRWPPRQVPLPRVPNNNGRRQRRCWQLFSCARPGRLLARASLGTSGKPPRAAGIGLRRCWRWCGVTRSTHWSFWSPGRRPGCWARRRVRVVAKVIATVARQWCGGGCWRKGW
jgi:hypothetical protein